MLEESTSQTRYEQMLAHSATAAICARSDNQIVSWNSAATQLFGHTAAEVIGQQLSMIIPARHHAAHHAGLARAVRYGQARLAGKSVEILALHAEGHEFPVELSLSMWRESGSPMFGALIRDITDRHSAKQRLEHLAHCDMLTSLPNRNALQERLVTAMNTGPCSLLLLDLNGFKHVNDSLGHSVGDMLLAAVAVRLTGAVDNIGYLARLGGDEFAILSGSTDTRSLDGLTTRIFDSLRAPFELIGQSIYVGTSIGIATSAKNARNVEKLISSADLALYSAKNKGGSACVVFEPAMQEQAEQRQRVGSELHEAVINNELELWYQPQVALDDHRLLGAEALLRWRHPSRGLLAPDAFIAVLEECTIAEEVGDWIVDQACAAAAYWQRSGLGALRVSINLFLAQFRSGRLFDVVTASLHRHGLAPGQIELEITENTVLRQEEHSTKSLRRLKTLGVGIALDDFGTGFASLSLLQKYPLTRLKIDRSFIACIDRCTGDAAIVDAVLRMARSLGLTVIAEGVETAEQVVVLKRLGCGEAQGYRFGYPMPSTSLVEAYTGKSHLASKAKLLNRPAVNLAAFTALPL